MPLSPQHVWPQHKTNALQLSPVGLMFSNVLHLRHSVMYAKLFVLSICAFQVLAHSVHMSVCHGRYFDHVQSIAIRHNRYIQALADWGSEGVLKIRIKLFVGTSSLFLRAFIRLTEATP